ncbi:OST5 (YGL226C-A) [Zygosaccharomyces parabailii]|nr:OST5 (YGL226C-A) [Zygosaccharomyces parabailii]
MSYAALKQEFKVSEVFEPTFQLKLQGRYALFSLIIATLVISMALVTVYSKSNFFTRLTIFTLLSAVGSLFSGIGIVFLANSLGVYV